METATGEIASDLQCGGLLCPLPMVKLALHARRLPCGSRIRVRASDARFEAELRTWSQMTGHRIESLEVGAEQVAVVRVMAPDR